MKRTILKANVEDLGRMDVANPKYDRLKLTKERLETIAADIRNGCWHSVKSNISRVRSLYIENGEAK